MKTKVFSPEGTDLASRRSAAHLRNQVADVLKSGDKVTFDLSNVSAYLNHTLMSFLACWCLNMG